MDSLSRWMLTLFQSTYNPLFHFGFGLSYTNFTYGPLSVTSKSGTPNGFQDGDVLTFSFAVSNVGDVMGRDVPQVSDSNLSTPFF